MRGLSMPVYKDKERGTWYTKFYYEDWSGAKKQKLKRGFPTKREALEFERDFLSSQAKNCDIKFSDLVNEYLDYLNGRLKSSTLQSHRFSFNRYLLPVFGDIPINKITPNMVRKWQEDMMGKELKLSTVKLYRTKLSAILNFAVRYYNLPSNPVSKTEPPKEIKKDPITAVDEETTVNENFWTKAEFDTAMKYVYTDTDKTIYYTLFYTGLRIGEFLALQVQDFIPEEKLIKVYKSMFYTTGTPEITTPKTQSSIRNVYIPQFLCDMLKKYIASIYHAKPTSFLFPYGYTMIANKINNLSKAAGIKRISVHGFRHSYASLLINEGYDIQFISEQLGHSDTHITQAIYGHFYPEKREKEISKLDNLG